MYKFDYSKIKLIIWDLDETFWKGTLSEGKIQLLENNIKLLKCSTDCGVVNSICSKNDLKSVNKILIENNLLDYFVFSSIDWTAKGNRIKSTIDAMHLRDSNVMFIDDNPSNRNEALYFCKNIIACDIDIIPSLLEYFVNIDKSDLTHKRLKQYKILEEKANVEKSFNNKNEFLLKSNIKVEINKDCKSQIDRIYELITRTNQLNFTKNRMTKLQLIALLGDSTIESGYVTVHDKYGDYGISGFYAIKNYTLVHFLFSCRILGMGVEQYVYEKLNKPKIKIIGEVSSSLTEPKVTWINSGKENVKAEAAKIGKKIVVHGPCDMELLFGLIRNNNKIIKELNYVNEKGVSIHQGNSTTHIVEYLKYSKEIRESDTLKKLFFYDDGMYKTHIFDKDNSFVLISTFTDPDIGRYKEKKTGIIVCFDLYFRDLTDISKQDIYIKMQLRGSKITKQDLEYLRDNFEYIGRISPEEIVNNFDYILKNLSKDCKLLITLPGEIECKTTAKSFLPLWQTQSKYYDDIPPHIYNKQMNHLIRCWAANKPNVILLDFNDYISGPESYTDKITHYQRNIYYKMCKKVISIVNEKGFKIRLRIISQKHYLKRLIKLSKRIVKKILRILHIKHSK